MVAMSRRDVVKDAEPRRRRPTRAAAFVARNRSLQMLTLMERDESSGDESTEAGDEGDFDQPVKRQRHNKKDTMLLSLKTAFGKRNSNSDVSKVHNIPLNSNAPTPTCPMREALCLSTSTDKLICREKEHACIVEYLKNAIMNSECGSRNLLISGVPGSGKTATVKNILLDLRKSIGNEFIDARVNCAGLASSNQVYSAAVNNMLDAHVRCTSGTNDLKELALDFRERRIASSDALEILTEIKSLTGRTNVIILDEIDCIGSQDVLYNIFDLSNKITSATVVIGISNTLNFQDNLKAKIKSRIGLSSVNFTPYTADNLRRILRLRLGPVNYAKFDIVSIEYASKKIANMSGDVRKFFQLCKISHDEALKEGEGKVGLYHVLKACEEMFRSDKTRLIQSCSKYQQILLLAIIFEIKIMGQNLLSSTQIRTRHSSLCLQFGLPPLSVNNWNHVVCKVEMLGIIKVADRRSRNEKLCLNAAQREVADSLKEQYTMTRRRNAAIGPNQSDVGWDEYFMWIAEQLKQYGI